MWLNTADMLRGFGISRPPWLHGLATILARPAARRFARQLLTFDALVGTSGLPTASAWICSHFAPGLDILGYPPPNTGPLLVVANHPGLLDAAALMTTLNRSDLKVIAIARPLLRALPHTRATIIPVGTTVQHRMNAVRHAMRHLQQGGAILTFPAGRIEPDPAHDLTAIASLTAWSASLDLFGRIAIGLPVVTAIVSHVQAPAALHHPLTRLRRNPADRQWLAAILQVLWPHLATTPVQIRFSPLLHADHNLRTKVQFWAKTFIQHAHTKRL
ncbi:MAG: 1-acyl-sn-glycerol-3-phosphate acyltransferase [Chloroflexus sp.]|nr:1-acyl-sn-glycerol-3-phosphate acyltransferase [Chloroflexus sp.]